MEGNNGEDANAEFDPFECLFGPRQPEPVEELRKLVDTPVPQFVPLFADGFPDYPPSKLPLPGRSLSSVPILVNVKQYRRILQRRIARSRQRPVRRGAYLHESRHAHACRRLRNGKGMFVKTLRP